MAKIKRGRDRMRPQGYRDGANREPMMSMDRDETAIAFENREIVGKPSARSERLASNKRQLDDVQATYHNRRIRGR
ncbi:MAG: hypothetical protein ACRCVD_12125 [Halioglobus sp.]